MGGSHGHGADQGERLYVHGHSVVHRLPAHVKTVALLAFVFTVVATPTEQFWAFGVYALLLIAVVAVARIPVRTVTTRMLVEIPFVFFAVLMPILGPDPRVDVLGVGLSQPGLLAAWGIMAKGTLGVVGSITLAATTPARDLLLGLERLRVPDLFVQIAGFMLRYSHVVTAEMERMRIARESRGFHATGPRQWKVLAQSAGALFIRSYERGERVHLAMLSRGYTGTMPNLGTAVAVRRDWVVAATLPAAALVACLLAWTVSS